MQPAPPSPKLVGVASTEPPYAIEQDTAREFAAAFFGPHLRDTPRLLSVFDNAGVRHRRFCVPLEWFVEGARSIKEKNDRFIASAHDLARAAIARVLDETDLAPADIDHVVFVTSTGLATPTIDARLIGIMGFRPETMRTPLFGLGCAGGALGLVHAARILQGQPRQRLLLVNVELCGVTFQHEDFSKSNLVATALFGDGVTAAVVVGGAVDAPGLEILDTGTHLWRDTLDVMGWNFHDHGMQVVFSSRIPRLVRDEMAGCLSAFLARGGRGLGDVDHFLVHPGGTKVLGAYREALALGEGALDRSRRILADHGNCSAATVMLVLEDFLRGRAFAAGEVALVTALGPGFSAGSALLRCP